jgi:hypothetical protein
VKEKEEAISGTVTGNDQHVGFRAMIMKQAIEYNLAGFTKNLPKSDDGKLGPADVKTVWHGILRSTLKGDDLKKLGPDD